MSHLAKQMSETSISQPFIFRPVGTTLLTIAVALSGAIAYPFLPVSPLPQVEYPVVSVSASLPGASPDTMASSVATPLERQFGRIAGVTEMTSSSSLGSTNVTLQFDLNRDVDAAARDVQAAINAARSTLPTNLPGNPTYRKYNPADSPILILSLTSDTYSKAAMYDEASSILSQKLSQVSGVGQVTIGGGALPAVRVDANPTQLNNMGVALQDVATVLKGANVHTAIGNLSDSRYQRSLGADDQLLTADGYKNLIVAYNKGAAVHLSDVANVTDSVENLQTIGLVNGKPAVLCVIFREPGANIIDTVDAVTAMMPELQAIIPRDMKLGLVMDRTTSIRDSVHDTKFTLAISIFLVIMVVFVFLRDIRTTFIPAVAVPVSLIGSLGVMYMCGYSIDNLSLMALTISTGFVVDDAIVVIENVTRYLEQGLSPLEAALKGAREIGFTVISMSISLIAVFMPILLMSGLIGRFFREFAVTLSVAIAVSMVVSLTTTPMMCAHLLKTKKEGEQHGVLFNATERMFSGIQRFYESTLRIALRHSLVMILVTIAMVAVTVYLYITIPKGFFPQQDSGRLSGSVQADQQTSFQAMARRLARFSNVISADKDVSTVASFGGGSGPGGGRVNSAQMFITLNNTPKRKDTSDEAGKRLTVATNKIPGALVAFQVQQDLRFGGRQSSAQYQYTMQGDDNKELVNYAPKLVDELTKNHSDLMYSVNLDLQNGGLEALLDIDRDTAARLNVTTTAIDNALNDAFGQAEVSTMYTPLNQYHVVLEISPEYLQSPEDLKYIYVKSTTGTLVPLSAVTRLREDTAALSVNHQGNSPAVTASFNLVPGKSLSDAVTAVNEAQIATHMPSDIHGSFQGTAKVFQDSLSNEKILIIAALAAVYLVLGMLYESLIHPLTILSTIPSAGVGALLSLWILPPHELDVMGMIGIILLIGIVKKNAIMMIDFALEAERKEGKNPQDAIFQACLLRFRPITMTTMAALLGGLPLALGTGSGGELRRPLGIAIVGGLIFSQMLTLYTTPVIYLYLDRLRHAALRGWRGESAPLPVQPLAY